MHTSLISKIIYSLTLLVLIIAAIPFVDGYLYKKEYMRVMTGLAEKYSAQGIKFEIVEYRLGWLHSSSKIRITTTDPQTLKYMPDGISLNDEITHGPIVFDSANNQYTLAYAKVANKVYLPEVFQQMLMPNQPGLPLVEISLLATFNNRWVSRISTIMLVVPRVGTLQFGESTATLEFSIKNGELDKYNIKSEIGAITFNSSNPSMPSFAIQPSHSAFDSIRGAGNIWNTSQGYAIPSVSVTWLDNSKLVMTTIDASSLDNIDANDLFQLNTSLNVKNINSPFFFITNFSDVKFYLNVNNVNYAGLVNYDKTTINSQTAIASINKLFTASSNFNYGLSFNSSLGALISSLKISFKPTANLANMQFSDLKSNIQIEASIKIAESLVKQVVIKYLEKMDNQTDKLMPASTPAVDQEPSDPVRDMVGALYRDGKITLNQSLDIFGVISANPDEQVFSQKMAEITPDNAAQLTQAYHATLVSTTQAEANKPGPATRDLRAQNMITSWQQQGYLIKEGNDFIINITNTDDDIKINGKSLPGVTPTTAMPVAPQTQ